MYIPASPGSGAITIVFADVVRSKKNEQITVKIVFIVFTLKLAQKKTESIELYKLMVTNRYKKNLELSRFILKYFFNRLHFTRFLFSGSFAWPFLIAAPLLLIVPLIC